MNDNQKAIQALNKSIDLKNDYENPYYALSLIYEEQNNLQELPPLLEKAKLNLATYSSQLHKKIQTYTEN